jgi:hypothetical protein
MSFGLYSMRLPVISARDRDSRHPSSPPNPLLSSSKANAIVSDERKPFSSFAASDKTKWLAYEEQALMNIIRGRSYAIINRRDNMTISVFLHSKDRISFIWPDAIDYNLLCIKIQKFGRGYYLTDSYKLTKSQI